MIKPNDMLFCSGMNGTGKTWLVRQYATQFENVIVLDTKEMFQWPEAPEAQIFNKLSDLQEFKEGKAIYRPDFKEMNYENYELFFEWIYLRKNTIVIVDEAMQICPTSRMLPTYYKGILTRGRERNTAVWSLTQRPKNIPLEIMSEAIHFFIFRLQLEDDRLRLREITGYEELAEPPGTRESHIFWYYNANTGKPPVRAIIKPK